MLVEFGNLRCVENLNIIFSVINYIDIYIICIYKMEYPYERVEAINIYKLEYLILFTVNILFSHFNNLTE